MGRDSKRLGPGGPLQPKLIEAVLRKQDGFCFGCNSRMNLTEVKIQHNLPKSLGGKSDVENLSAMCQNCHGYSLKSLRLPNYLLSQLENWKQDNGIENSFSTLVRHAITNEMNRQYVDYDEYLRMEMKVAELEKKLFHVENQLEAKSKTLREIIHNASSSLRRDEFR